MKQSTENIVMAVIVIGLIFAGLWSIGHFNLFFTAGTGW